MTMTQQPLTRELVEWAARETLRMHSEMPDGTRATGRCRQCPANPDECPQLAWALAVLHAHQPQPARTHGRTRP
jgi:hypothetical protein